ncbi:hypothetical protein Droror1_Dr00011700 [Drosera rotundifolia]
MLYNNAPSTAFFFSTRPRIENPHSLKLLRLETSSGEIDPGSHTRLAARHPTKICKILIGQDEQIGRINQYSIIFKFGSHELVDSHSMFVIGILSPSREQQGSRNDATSDSVPGHYQESIAERCFISIFHREYTLPI